MANEEFRRDKNDSDNWFIIVFYYDFTKRKIFNYTLFNDKFEIDFRDKIHR